MKRRTPAILGKMNGVFTYCSLTILLLLISGCSVLSQEHPGNRILGGGDNSAITGGSSNVIVGGNSNEIDGPGSRNVIGGGVDNKILQCQSNNFIGGGSENQIFASSFHNAILAGKNNVIRRAGDSVTIIGGSDNTFNPNEGNGGSNTVIIGNQGTLTESSHALMLAFKGSPCETKIQQGIFVCTDKFIVNNEDMLPRLKLVNDHEEKISRIENQINLNPVPGPKPTIMEHEERIDKIVDQINLNPVPGPKPTIQNHEERISALEGNPTKSPTRLFVCGNDNGNLNDDRQCAPNEACDMNEDCIHGNCDDDICDATRSKRVVITFAVFIVLTFCCGTCCCCYCCLYQYQENRQTRERFRRKRRTQDAKILSYQATGFGTVMYEKEECLKCVVNECMVPSLHYVNVALDCGNVLEIPRKEMSRRFRIITCIVLQLLHLDLELNDDKLKTVYKHLRTELRDILTQCRICQGAEATIEHCNKVQNKMKELGEYMSSYCYVSMDGNVVAVKKSMDGDVEGAGEHNGNQIPGNRNLVEEILTVEDTNINYNYWHKVTDNNIQSENGYQRLELMATNLLPIFVCDSDNRAKGVGFARMFPRLYQYPFFYGTMIILMVIIFLMFLVKVGDDNDAFAEGSCPPSIEGPCGWDGRPGGMGKPFFGIPPQYEFSESTPQSIAIPIVYGIMHNVLFMLGLIPLPFCRGFIRDISNTWPSIRKHIPLNDLEYFHRLCGFLALSGIFLAATIWLSVMGIDCLKRGTPNACLAFDPIVEKFGNPIENVLMLRFIIWVLWFTFLPLIYFTKVIPPPSFVFKIPGIGIYWYEFCYYSHIIVAAVTLLLAFIARFFIFYPVLISWSIYLVDIVRERMLHCVRAKINTNINGRESTYYHDSNDDPVIVKLKVTPTRNFKVKAGQWLYVKFSGCGSFHPFSVTNRSSKEKESVTMLIGVKTNGQDFKTEHRLVGNRKVLDKKTWTYELLDKVRSPSEKQHVNILGPYGDAFESCFDATRKAAIVIGAGTGLASIMSVLREAIHRRHNEIRVPKRMYFVWCCRDLVHLRWCWNDILKVLVDAEMGPSLDLRYLHEKSSLFHWINVTFFVSGLKQDAATKNLIDSSMPLYERDYKNVIGSAEKAKRIREWMMNQVIEGGIDELTDNENYIERLLNGVKQQAMQELHGEVLLKNITNVTVCYTGPPGLGFLVKEATQTNNVNCEFSSDHQ